MSDQPAQTPLLELARSVPKDLRGEWEIQWADDGRPTGHSMAPVGKYLHDMADEIDVLRHKLVAEKAIREHQAKRIETLEAALRRQSRRLRQVFKPFGCEEPVAIYEFRCDVANELEQALKGEDI